jgi:beta-fructofuranosidase
MNRFAGIAALSALAAAVGCGSVRSAESEPQVVLASTEQPLLSVGPEWVRRSTLKSTYDPGTSAGWFFNDHTYIKDDTGKWHLFGITDDDPLDVEASDQFGHATATSLTGPWTTVTRYALTTRDDGPSCSGLAKAGCYRESHLWAPHIIKSGTKYYMFYSGGNAKTDAAGNRIRTQEEINLATATSLNGPWTRDPGGPLFLDGYEARDPMVLNVNGTWVMYYTATADPYNDSQHVVAYRTSTDLVNWSASRLGNVFTDVGDIGTDAGGTESPFVVDRVIGGTHYYYLFLGPRPYELYLPPDYPGTDVYVSTQWNSFDPQKQAGHLGVHAAEVVNDSGAYYVSDAGWEKDNVSLFNLEFLTSPVKGSTLYALTTAKDKILKWNGATNTWSQIGGASSSLVGGGLGLFSVESGSLYRYDTGVRTKVASTGTGFAVNTDSLYRKDGSGVSKWIGPGDSWQNIGTAATTLYAGAKELFASNPWTGDIWQYSGTGTTWAQVGGGGDSWAVNVNGLYGTQFWGTFQWSGAGTYWIGIGDSTSNLIAGGDKLYATDASGTLLVYSNTPGQWSPVANSATAFAACDDMLYALRGTTVYKQAGTMAGTALAMGGYAVSSIVCGK